MTLSQSTYRSVLLSLALSFVSILLAFLVFAANIHDGSRFLIGHLIELSVLWPALLPRPIGLAGPPAFIAWLLLAFAGYFVVYLSVIMIMRRVRSFFTDRI